MNSPPPPAPVASTDQWILEVVRGVRVGQQYPVAHDQIVLGSGRAHGPSETILCLADQEGTSSRKMAASHVALSRSDDGSLRLVDLDTPGGTFVNNRRLLPGPPTPLVAGDVIQLGAVQLRVARAVDPPPAPRPPGGPPPVVATFLYRTGASGATCRTWDDFLPLSAQKWDELRADLVAGRLTEFVGSVGRPDLSPSPTRTSLTTDQADERLNDWLGRLPTRTPTAPGLDVHPLRLMVAVPAGGVTIARKFQISNVGYGLLRVRVQAEAADGLKLTLGTDFADREVVVQDSVSVGFEITVPDRFSGPVTSQVVVLGAGVEQRVTVQVERISPSTTAGAGGDATTTGVDPGVEPGLLARFRELSTGKRLAIAALLGLASRLLVGVAGGAIGEDAVLPSGPEVPHLGGVVLAFGLIGAGLGGWWLARRSGRADAGAGAVAGAGLGALLAAAAVALCRVVEPALGPVLGSPFIACVVWSLVGGALACLVHPVEEPDR